MINTLKEKYQSARKSQAKGTDDLFFKNSKLFSVLISTDLVKISSKKEKK